MERHHAIDTRWVIGPNDRDLGVKFQFPNTTGEILPVRVHATSIGTRLILLWHGKALLWTAVVADGVQTTEVMLGGRGVWLFCFNSPDYVAKHLELEIRETYDPYKFPKKSS